MGTSSNGHWVERDYIIGDPRRRQGYTVPQPPPVTPLDTVANAALFAFVAGVVLWSLATMAVSILSRIFD
jgi:hypothetical protein